MVSMWQVFLGLCRQGHYHLIVKVIWNWMDLYDIFSTSSIEQQSGCE